MLVSTVVSHEPRAGYNPRSNTDGELLVNLVSHMLECILIVWLTTFVYVF